MLDLNSFSVIYSRQVRHLLPLHVKIPKPVEFRLSLAAAHIGTDFLLSHKPLTQELSQPSFEMGD